MYAGNAKLKNLKSMTTKSILNWRGFPAKGEVNNEPALTIPDDSLSIKEILDRYARGLPLGGERVPVYNGDQWLPDFDRMSTIERAEWLSDNAEYIRELQENSRNGLVNNEEEGATPAPPSPPSPTTAPPERSEASITY